jgi:aspartate racemase
MKTIGVLGGMGPAATVDFYRRIVEAVEAARDQDHLHVLIDSDPSVPDRTAFLLGDGPDPVPALIAMARRLEGAGAELLVMACNTASAFAPRVAAAVGVPLLNWPDEVARGILARRPQTARAGVLATTGTIATGLYQRAFGGHGVAVLVPDAPAQEQVMQAIYGPEGVKAGSGDWRTARAQVLSCGEGLAEAGADVLVLACTELSVLFAPGPDGARAAAWPVPTYDAAQVVAERVVELAGGRLRRPQSERDH